MDAHVAGIPGQLHPAAVGRMSQMSIEHWDKPMKELPDDGRILCVLINGHVTSELLLGA